MAITPFSPRGGSDQAGGVDFPAALSGEQAEKDYALPFQHRLLLPKNTAIETPYEYVMPLPIGRVMRLWVEMPKNCAGQVGIQIWRRVYQIFPLPEGQWYISDNTTISFAFTHSINNEPYEVLIKGYNLDDTYEHKPWVAFEVAGAKSDLPENLQKLIDYLKG